MKQKRKLTGMLLMLALIVACVFTSMEANAGGGNPALYQKGKTTILKKYSNKGMNYYIVVAKDYAKFFAGLSSLKVTSSNKKVVSASGNIYSSELDNNRGSIQIIAKKAGVSTITIKTEKGGSNFTYKMKVKVVNYENPFKKITIGKTNITKAYKKVDYANGPLAASGSKLNIKPAKNWKINRITCYHDGKSETIKNNQTFSYGENQESVSLHIEMYNKKTKAIQGITYYMKK